MDHTQTLTGIDPIDLALGSLTPVRALIAGRFAGRSKRPGVAALGDGNTFYVQSKTPRAGASVTRPNIQRYKPVSIASTRVTEGTGKHRRLLPATDLGAAGTAAFQLNVGNRARNRAYLEEAYYLILVETALRFQAAANYPAALSWLQLAGRLRGTTLESVGPFLALDATGGLDPIAGAPATDPLDAHHLARRRPGAYTRFTVATMVRLLVDTPTRSSHWLPPSRSLARVSST